MQTLKKISDCFSYLTPVSITDRPILGIVTGKNYSLMIDAGNSEAHANLFLEQLIEHSLPLPNFVILTHWHWDHIFGLSALKFPSISSIETKKAIEKLVPLEWTNKALDERVKSGEEIEFCANAIKEEFQNDREICIKLPTITFERRMELDLGGVSCIFQLVGGDHSSDSVIIYIKEEKILFLGDCIYPDIYAKKRKNTVEATLSLLKLIEQFDAETYILSHWKPISKIEYEQEATILRTAANLAAKHYGDISAIKKEYEEIVNRSLTEDELETIQYFVNGF